MKEENFIKVLASGANVPLKVRPGHFATNHSHINYYIDTTTLKTRTSDSQEIARALAGMYLYDTVVDTIVCMEGTEVIGAYLAEELTKSGFLTANAHKTIYVVTPEFNNNSQLIFRQNLVPEIAGKHILILMAMVTTGLSVNKALECVQYYQGIISGVSSIFSNIAECNGIPIRSVFGQTEIPDYAQYDYRQCPYCAAGVKLTAMVNAFGYEEL